MRWNLGDSTWKSSSNCKELKALERYLELQGVPDIYNCRENWKRVHDPSFTSKSSAILIRLQMKSIFEVVHKIANTSGLAYSPESGGNIGPESQQIWDDIVKVSLSL